MDVITAIQLQLQGMCKAAADCLDASTQHGKADSVQIDTTVRAGGWGGGRAVHVAHALAKRT